MGFGRGKASSFGARLRALADALGAVGAVGAVGMVGMVGTVGLSGCAVNPPWLPSAGPSVEQVRTLNKDRDPLRLEGIQLVEVNDAIARKLLAGRRQVLFSDSFAEVPKTGFVVGAGDVVRKKS